jgi:hypothetical protein
MILKKDEESKIIEYYNNNILNKELYAGKYIRLIITDSESIDKYSIFAEIIMNNYMKFISTEILKKLHDLAKEKNYPNIVQLIISLKKVKC